MTARRRLGWLAAAALAAAAAVLALADPEASRLFPRCLFWALTDLHCPGCGVQRALHDLLHGRPLEALSHNALVVVLGPPALAGLAAGRLAPERTRALAGRIPPRAWTLVPVVVVAFWALRNVPVWPLAALAP